LLSVEGGTGHIGAEVGASGAEFVRVGPEGRALLTVRVLELAALLPVRSGRSLCDEFAAASAFEVFGVGAAYSSNNDLTYALSALATGSPSLTKLKKILFLNSLLSGFAKGSSDTGGAPNVTQ